PVTRRRATPEDTSAAHSTRGPGFSDEQMTMSLSGGAISARTAVAMSTIRGASALIPPPPGSKLITGGAGRTGSRKGGHFSGNEAQPPDTRVVRYPAVCPIHPKVCAGHACGAHTTFFEPEEAAWQHQGVNLFRLATTVTLGVTCLVAFPAWPSATPV